MRKSKKRSWREFCNKISRTTPIRNVWGMIRKMRGIRREQQYPILQNEEEVAISHKVVVVI